MSETLPVLAGFYPDPSVCRVGDVYYLVNSSFEYLPGLPLHSSTDLIEWTPVGNALTRTSQIDEHAGAASSGIYAPTIRHHEGRFWVIGTNILDLAAGRGHFIITADDPAGPWSDPVWMTGVIGIDPDITWDDDGTCLVTWASAHPDLHGIVVAPVDTSTGELLAAPRRLWQGTGLAHPEGPHLYRRDGWWYLLLAEGGTERGHAVTIARARSLDGPFEAAPHNPLLSHRSTAHSVQNVGHADLVELADGSWAAVHLGVRPRGQTPGFHVNGRETFVVGIDWHDGWPVADEERFEAAERDHSFADDFGAPALDPRWLGAGAFPASFSRPAPGGGIVIDADASTAGRSLLATRARDTHWAAEVRIDSDDSAARFSVRMDDRHWYGIEVDDGVATAVLAVGPVVHTVGAVDVPRGTPVTLRITVGSGEDHPYVGPSEPDVVTVAVVDSTGSYEQFGPFDGRYLSTEVAGGFVGRVVGVEALRGRTRVLDFSYTSTTTPST